MNDIHAAMPNDLTALNDRVQMALKEAQEAGVMIRDIADRLFGPIPSALGACTERTEPVGCVEVLNESLDHLFHRLATIREEVARLQRL